MYLLFWAFFFLDKKYSFCFVLSSFFCFVHFKVNTFILFILNIFRKKKVSSSKKVNDIH